MSGQLLGNVLLFGRVLRGLGLDAGTGRMTDLVRALAHVPLGSKGDVYHATRALIVSRRDEIPLFDRAFEAFWRKPAEGETTLDLRSMGERRRFRRPAFAPAAATPETASRDTANRPESDPPFLQVTLTYSAQELLRRKDFGELTAEELAQVRRAILDLAWKVPRTRSRRLRTGAGRRLDLRRTLRRSMRHGGEVLEWAHRERRPRPRPLVVLADISGSMERYTRLLLLFLHTLSEGLEAGAETFLFGTRLTRITREISGRGPEEALAAAAAAAPDWSGGTRIGETLHEFNFRWGRRVLGRGAVVLLISDGWDRGDPDLLAAEMARLQRSAHRVIWLNPLLGGAEYEPLTRGIRAALPYVDDFLPVHNLASLELLARRLETLPEARPLRRQRPHTPAASDTRVG
jgi:hypothetical protein